LKPYGHLTSEERAQIEILRKQGAGPTAISRQPGLAKSMVSRELRRPGAGAEYEAGRELSSEESQRFRIQ
jgi:IS30 family transposase